MIDIIFGGAQKAVLSTKTIGDIDDITVALDVSDGVLLCIDYDDRVISRNRQISKMTPKMVAQKASNVGLEEIVFTDHGRRRKDAPKLDIISDLVKSGLGVYISGNIVEKDLPGLQKAGVKGALLDLGEIIMNW